MGRNIISRQQRRLRERGFTEEQAKRIAFRQQRAAGNTQGSSFRLSETGAQYSELSPLEREILRRSQRSGRPPSHYIIKNGKVSLKPQYRGT